MVSDIYLSDFSSTVWISGYVTNLESLVPTTRLLVKFKRHLYLTGVEFVFQPATREFKVSRGMNGNIQHFG